MTIKKRKLKDDLFGGTRYKYVVSDSGYSLDLLVERFCCNCQIVTVGGIEDLLDLFYKNHVVTLTELYNSVFKTLGVPRILIDVNCVDNFIPEGFRKVNVLNYVSSYDHSKRRMILIEKNLLT